MLIASRNSVEGTSLPYNAEVEYLEYLESTGTQWIDTGVIGGSSTKVRVVAASTNISVNASLFGARHGGSNRPSYCVWQRAASGSDGTRFDYNSATTDSVVGVNAWQTGSVNEILKDGPRNYVNGVEVSANRTHSFALAYPFFLFNVDGGGTPTAYPSVGSVYECQIWDSGGTLVRDFIPVRVGSEGCLYDRRGVGGMNPDGSARTDGLYRNRGTGAFIIGPDKSRSN